MAVSPWKQSTSQASSKPGVAANNRPWAFRNTVNEGAYLGAVVPAMKEGASPGSRTMG